MLGRGRLGALGKKENKKGDEGILLRNAGKYRLYRTVPTLDATEGGIESSQRPVEDLPS